MDLPDEVQEAISQAHAEMLADSFHTLLPKQRLPIYRATEVLEEPPLTRFRTWLAILTAQKVLPVWESNEPDDDLAQRILEITEGLLKGELTKEETKDDREFFYNAVGNADEYVESSRARAALDAAYSALKANFGYAPFEKFNLQQIENGLPDEIIADTWCDAAGVGVLAYSGVAYDMDSYYEESISPQPIDEEELAKLRQLALEQLEQLSHGQPSSIEETSGGGFVELLAFQNENEEKEQLSGLEQSPNKEFDPEIRKEFWEWWFFEAIPQAWDLAHQK